MDSNTHQIYDQNSQPISGLVRLRSAPSSLLANFSGGFEPDGLQIHRFRSSDADLESPNAENFEEKSPATAAYAVTSSQHHNQSYASLPPHYPRPNVAVSSSAMDDGSYQFLTTKPLNSNLARQSSSPAGMFTNLHVQNGGYGSIKNMMSYDSSTRPPSSLGMISQTGNANAAFRSQYDHWNDQSSLMENLPGVKMESQNGEAGNHVQLLSHHLSLPKTSSEMAAMEKIFQMDDSVPFKIRAKRGCATHPRSIAERVRRTKISERMRKLQELVPNMDKQMNTADMLDLAVEYIKALQGQFKMLSDNQANCKCKNTEKKPIQNQMV